MFCTYDTEESWKGTLVGVTVGVWSIEPGGKVKFSLFLDIVKSGVLKINKPTNPNRHQCNLYWHGPLIRITCKFEKCTPVESKNYRKLGDEKTKLIPFR